MYRILGSAELFPQHCQVPNLSLKEHLPALTEELQTTAQSIKETPKGRAMIRILQQQLDELIELVQMPPEQRVSTTNTHPPIERPIKRVLQAPAIMKTRDQMAKRNLILMKRSHCQTTCNNTPEDVPQITRDARPTIIPDYVSRKHNVTKNYTLRRSPWLISKMPGRRGVTFTPIQGLIANNA